jgi:hypothetical protein
VNGKNLKLIINMVNEVVNYVLSKNGDKCKEISDEVSESVNEVNSQ